MTTTEFEARSVASANDPERRVRALDAVLLSLGAIFMVSASRVLLGYGNYYEFAHFAEIARNISEGQGFTTYYAQPASLAFYAANGIEGPPWPVVERFIGYPYLLSLAFRAFGASDGVALWFNTGVFALMAPLVYAVGTVVFSRRTAIVATLVFILNPMFTANYAVYGFIDPTFGLIVLCVSAALLQLWRTDRPVRMALIAGLLSGLAYCVRYNVMFSLPVYLGVVMIAVPRQRLAASAAYVAGVTAFVIPVILYHLHLTGMTSIYQSGNWMMAEETVTGTEPWRNYVAYSASQILVEHWPLVIEKLSYNITNILLIRFPGLHNLQLLLPFVALGIYLSRTPERMRLLVVIGLPFMLQLGAMMLTHPEFVEPIRWTDRYYFWATPMFLLFGAQGVRDFAAIFPRPRLALLVWFALLMLSFTRWYTPINRFYPDSYFARDYLMTEVPDDALVATNLLANSFTYYYGVPTMEIPYDPAVIGEIQRDWEIDYIFIDLRPDELSFMQQWLGLYMTDQCAAYGQQYGFELDRVFHGEGAQLLGFSLRRTGLPPSD